MALAMYQNYCEPVHGGVAGPLVKQRPLDSTDAAAGKLVSGRVVSVNSSGDFVAGLNAVQAMPLFLVRGTDAPSVYNTGTSGSVTYWQPVSGTGEGAIAMVATGGYEVQSTEFDSTKTYTPNTLLTSDANGKLTPATLANVYSTEKVVGVCSVHENPENVEDAFESGEPPRGKNAHGVDVLTFWSVYIPAKSS